MRHAVPAPVDASTPEPVLIASAVQAVLIAAATLGWTYLDDARIAAIVTAVATLAAVVAAMVARGRVRPIRPGDPARPDRTRLELDRAALLEAIRATVRAELAATPPLGVHAGPGTGDQPETVRRHRRTPAPAWTAPPPSPPPQR